jgi:hypothetical protein
MFSVDFPNPRSHAKSYIWWVVDLPNPSEKYIKI